jgi:ligand-binding sensor domain-containing protein
MYQSILLIVLSLLCLTLKAQYPPFFNYNSESGLPSEDVYCIAEDPKGFIWIGCDEGLFRYNGVKYIPYRSQEQKSRPITGIGFSSSGRLYCYNFKWQIFYVENDSLKELKCGLEYVYYITTDKKTGGLYVGHKDGLSFFDETTNTWKHHKVAFDKHPCHVRNPTLDNKGNVWFYDSRFAGTLRKDGTLKLLEDPVIYENIHGAYLMTAYDEGAFMFSFVNGNMYRFDGNKIEEYVHPVLHKLLKTRKLTCARLLKDGNFWIGSYNGVIRFNPRNRSVNLYYPKMAISDCILDREGNYWFSTLQNGLIRVPYLDNILWNVENNSLPKEKINMLTVSDTMLYFASADGLVAGINTNTLQINTYETNIASDIQCLNIVDNKLYYLIQHSLFELFNEKPKLLSNNFLPIKVLLKADGQYVFGTAVGAIIVDKIVNPTKKILITEVRVRDGLSETEGNRFWLATDVGLMSYTKNKEGIWAAQDSFLKGVQISSIDADFTNKIIYTLDFKGNIYSVSNDYSIKKISKLPNNIQGFKLKFGVGKIFVATQKGLWFYDLKKKEWKSIGRLQGLASNNLRDIALVGDFVWLAGTKGLQRIPLETAGPKPRSLVFLYKLLDSDNKNLNPERLIQLNYRQAFILKPEAVANSADKNFRFAYRIRTNSNEWYYFPSNIEEIRIAGLRTGYFELELKIVDQEGMDSENIIVLKGYVASPYWQRWEFYLLILLAVSALVFWTVRYQISRLRAKQAKEIQRLQLENELRFTRETALKAQMNPHFLFNVLNSIKGYIYENDKKSAIAYLNRFSDLIRKILELSSMPKVKLAAELELLKVYIDLEAMLQQQDFSYTINVDENIDTNFTEIPSLLLQPYIENAFKHGLRHKEGAQRIEINIRSEDDDFILVEISDNGIGRSAAAEINKKSATIHQSFATSATEKRIQLLNQKNEAAVSVGYEDLFNELGLACGTKVSLKINING